MFDSTLEHKLQVSNGKLQFTVDPNLDCERNCDINSIPVHVAFVIFTLVKAREILDYNRKNIPGWDGNFYDWCMKYSNFRYVILDGVPEMLSEETGITLGKGDIYRLIRDFLSDGDELMGREPTKYDLVMAYARLIVYHVNGESARLIECLVRFCTKWDDSDEEAGLVGRYLRMLADYKPGM